jgi:superfamily II DNA or RNA helicase
MASHFDSDDLIKRLDEQKSKWYLPRDPVIKEIINPALAAASKFDCMSGYFSTYVLRDLSHGLAHFLKNSSQPLRFLISAEISVEDQAALRQGLDPNKFAIEIIEKAFQDERTLESALIQHTKSCLAYLVYYKRLEIKVVLMKTGMFHPKQWFFYSGDDVAVLSGSANATSAALGKNVEQLYLQRSWKSADERQSCASDINFFNEYWGGSAEDSITVSLPDAFTQNLLQGFRSTSVPTFDSYEKALLAEQSIDLAPSPGEDDFSIPTTLEWESGNYSHQGRAVTAWERAGRVGILSMATGSGKTITSMIAAQRLSEEVESLLIVVAVPTRPLLRQWEEDLIKFGLSPYVADHGSSEEHLRTLDTKLNNLDLGFKRVDSIVITLNLLKTEGLSKIFANYEDKILLIADEMHNLGSDKFTANPPRAKYRLGLSATPERQYDEQGTYSLFRYFGSVVFEFSLKEAIGICLVPYDYFIHQVNLTPEELQDYMELSEDIRSAYARTGGTPTSDEESRIQRLLEKRRLVLESATNKIDELESLLRELGPERIQHTLIYCTDKNPNQLLKVNYLLKKLGIRFHQITDEESGNRKKIAEALYEFRNGNIKVITAKRILDEGFNIPEICTAIILASTTVERQWTQRRGRVLRMAPGKEFAVIHDFLAIPPAESARDEDSRKIIQGELIRAKEFADLSRNKLTQKGAYSHIQDLEILFTIWRKN